MAGKLEAYDPSKTCSTCVHLGGGDCEMYHRSGVVIVFDHRLVRCNWHERSETADTQHEPELDSRGPDRDEWRHEAIQTMRLK